MKLTLFAFVFVTLAALALADPVPCAMNETFMSCGTACPEHCAIRNARGELETQNMVCNKMCVPGCFCANGFVRDLKRSNTCVVKTACSPP